MSFATASHLRPAPLSGWLFLPTLKDAIYIDDLFLLIFSKKLEIVHEWIWDEDLNDEIPDNSSGSNENTVDVSAKRKRH